MHPVKATIMATVAFFCLMCVVVLTRWVDSPALSDSERYGAAIENRYAQTGFNGMAQAVVRTAPFLSISVSDNPVYDRATNQIREQKELNYSFSQLAFCTYDGPVDMAFAMAIVAAEAFNRPVLWRHLEYAVFRSRGSPVNSDLSLGPLQMTSANIRQIVEREGTGLDIDRATRLIIDGLENKPCDNLDLVGKKLAEYAPQSDADKSWSDYLTRLANAYHSGQDHIYTRTLYTDIVQAARDVMLNQDRDGVLVRNGQSNPEVTFYTNAHTVGFFKVTSPALRLLSGDHCFGRDKAGVRLFARPLYHGSETLKSWQNAQQADATKDHLKELTKAAQIEQNARLIKALTQDRKATLQREIQAARIQPRRNQNPNLAPDTAQTDAANRKRQKLEAELGRLDGTEVVVLCPRA